MFTQNQVKELLKNKNVFKCGLKSIGYSKKFKLLAIKKYYEDGYSPRMIFEEAGFDLNVLGKDKPKDCLRRWKRIYNQKGKKGLEEEKRGSFGGRPKVKFKSQEEEIKYLKTKITYIKAENDFLAKLRGLKRE